VLLLYDAQLQMPPLLLGGSSSAAMGLALL
jgi:hypothetical protein